MDRIQKEPPDYHGYDCVYFPRDTFKFYYAAVRFYESVLIDNLDAMKTDEDLRTLLGEARLESFPIAKELERTRRARDWFAKYLPEGGWEGPDFDVSVSHGWVRYVKSVAMLYLEHLRERRDALASRPRISKYLLRAVDQQISSFEEKANIGIFRNATPSPLLLAELPEASVGSLQEATAVAPVSIERQRRPVVLDTIEIQDTELRKRCLDLFAQFREEGAHDRLDTVVNEATRILEDRLRSLTGAPATCTGVDLARYGFAVPDQRLNVSDLPAEQEAAHLLYRGVFGFIRNSVHHRLVETLQPERVLQIVGMIDYLISVAESARRAAPARKSANGA
jgi:hypothetical protein